MFIKNDTEIELTDLPDPPRTQEFKKLDKIFPVIKSITKTI